MPKRILVAGVLGGLAMFFWSFVAHMALPLGEAGIRDIPNAQPLLASMTATLGQTSGLYLFPGVKGASMEDNMKAIETNPSGLLLYRPIGTKYNFGAMLGFQLLMQIVEALLAAYLLSQTRIVTFAGRVGFVAVAGLLASMTTNSEYWNWYSFPAAYVTVYAFTQFAGFVLAGLIAAWQVKPAKAY